MIRKTCGLHVADLHAVPACLMTAYIHAELPIVYTNDGIDIHGVKALVESGQIQSIVISPGPGTPEVGTDIGERPTPM